MSDVLGGPIHLLTENNQYLLIGCRHVDHGKFTSTHSRTCRKIKIIHSSTQFHTMDISELLTDDTIFRLSQLHTTRIVQPFQQGWTPIAVNLRS